MHFKLPKRRELFAAWSALMVLTLGTMWAGKVEAEVSLGAVWSILLLVLAGLKVGVILWFYLNLRRSTGGWKKGFITFLVLLLGVILGTYLLTPVVYP